MAAACIERGRETLDAHMYSQTPLSGGVGVNGRLGSYLDSFEYDNALVIIVTQNPFLIKLMFCF